MIRLALSIRNPWPYSILHHDKDIENRSWRTPVRGRVLIHASSARPTKQDMNDWRHLLDHMVIDYPDIHAKDFPAGGFVGSVEIVDCVTDSRSPWFFGPYGFVLRDPRPLPFMPYRGSLGFFDLPEGVFGFYRTHHGIDLKEEGTA